MLSFSSVDIFFPMWAAQRGMTTAAIACTNSLLQQCPTCQARLSFSAFYCLNVLYIKHSSTWKWNQDFLHLRVRLGTKGASWHCWTPFVLGAGRWQSGSPCPTRGRVLDLMACISLGTLLTALLFQSGWKLWAKSNISFSLFFFLEVPQSEMPNGKCQLGGNCFF